MAIEVERLIATLEAKMDKFEKSLAKASGTADRQFKKVEDRGKRMEKTLAGLGVASFKGLASGAVASLAPLLSLTAAVQGAKAALQEFGDIADDAKASGLDAEFFQGLAYQAQLGGVAYDQLSSALATFAKNSGLAVVGKGKMVTALKALNPELLENIRSAATQAERVKIVADAINAEADASRRAAIATAAFGEAGSKLAGVFEGGADQIERLQVSAKNLGLIVDRELIARADQLGDEYDTTAKIVDLKLKRALVNLGPVLIWLTGLAGGVAEQLGQAVDGLNAIERRATATLEARLKGIDDQIAVGNDPMQSPNLAQATPFDPAALEAERASIMKELRARALGNLTSQLTALAVAPEDTATLDEIDSRNKAADAAIKQAEAVKKLTADLGLERQQLFMTAEQQAAVNAVSSAGIDISSEQGQKLVELALANEQLKNSMQAVNDIARTAIGTFVDDLKQGKSAADALTNALGKIADKLLDMALDNAISGLVGNLFGAFGGGGIGGLKSVPGLGGLTGSVSYLRRAKGGPVVAGKPYMVGEKGPEMIVPSQSGRVIPNGAGSNIIINIDAKGAEIGVEQKIALAIKQVVPKMIQEQAPGAVAVSQRNRSFG